MNERQPTLQEVGDEAARLNSLHKYAEEQKTSEKARYDRLEKSTYDSTALANIRSQRTHSQVFYGEKSQAALNDSASHFEAHQGAYHGLAVIEAHMAGVAIAVETPLTIGETPEQLSDEAAHK